jgi:carbon storage regulator
MLVLSRKTSQRIKIGDSIVITVVKIAGNVVRLGIEAPLETPIVRDELSPNCPIRQSPSLGQGKVFGSLAVTNPALTSRNV